MNALAQELIPNTPEWLEARRHYLGASDAAAALGISQWCSQRKLAELKKGLCEPDPQNEAMYRGHVLEPVIRNYFRSQYSGFDGPRFAVHPIHAWMAATLDDEIHRIGMPEERHVIVEIKSVLSWAADGWGDEGTADIPPTYFCQVQHQLAVTGADACEVLVLFASQDVFYLLVRMADNGADLSAYMEGLDLRAYSVERDDDFINNILIPGEREFWTLYVEGDDLPPDYKVCQTKAGRAATADEISYIEDSVLPTWQAAKSADAQLEEVKARMQAILKDAESLDCGKLGKIQWKRGDDNTVVEVDWQAVARTLADWSGTALNEGDGKALIAQHTKTEKKPGTRRFLWPSKWGK